MVKFHGLRGQQEVTPWILQVSMRDSEAWHLLNDLTQNKVWTLLGTVFKSHTLTQSKQAAALQALLGKGKNRPQGQSKGKGKHQTST